MQMISKHAPFPIHRNPGTRSVGYATTFAEELGASLVEAATRKICEAVVSHVHESISRDEAQARPQIQNAKFRKIPIASDGMCGWHALVAVRDLSRYQQVPRNEGAYPCSKRLLIEQEQAAKELHSSVCKQALEVCHPRFHDAIHRVMGDPQYIPTDLEWIAKACKTTIRCTCTTQALQF